MHLVPKKANLPNHPELWLIEIYWAIFEGKLKKMKWNVKGETEFKRKWSFGTAKVSDVVCALMASITGKLNFFGIKSN